MADTHTFTERIVLEAVNEVSSELKKIRADVKKQFKGVRDEAEKVKNSMGGVKQGVMGVRTAIFALSAFASGKLVSSFIKAGSEVENFTTQFKVLLGSTDAAKKKIEELTEYSKKTPFQFADLAEAEKLMISFGVDVSKTSGYLKVLGDISLGNQQKFQSLSLAFSQMQSAGRLMGQDLLQMINAGFNPLKIISEQTGESMLSLKDRMSKGKMSADEVTKAFESATQAGGMFHKGLEEMSGTASGLSSTIKDQLNAAMRDMMDSGVWDSLKSGLLTVSQTMSSMLEDGTFKRWGDGLMGLVEAAGAFGKAIMAVREMLHGPDSIGDDNFLTDPKVTAQVKQNIDRIVELKGDIISLTSAAKQYNAIQGLYNDKAIEANNKLHIAKQEEKKLIEETEKITGSALSNDINLLMRKSMALGKNVEMTQKLNEETGVKPGAKPKSPDEEKYKAGVTVEKDLTGQWLQEKEQMAKDAETARYMALYDHQIAMTELQQNTRQQELDLNALHFEKLAEQEQVNIEDQLRRKELERTKADEINKKWDKKDAAENEKNQKTIDNINKARIDSNFGVASSYASAASNMGKIMGASGNEFKAFAMAEMAIQEVRAFMMALNNPPGFPFSGPQAAAAGILGATKLGVVATQKFHSGGTIPGTGERNITALGGEGVVSPEGMAGIGPGGLAAINNRVPVVNNITNQISFAPTYNQGVSEPGNIFDSIGDDLPRLAEMVKSTVDRGFLDSNVANGKVSFDTV